MFLDANGHGAGGDPERQPHPRPQLSLNEQKVLFWIAGVNLVLLLVAPIGGATLFELIFGMLK